MEGLEMTPIHAQARATQQQESSGMNESESDNQSRTGEIQLVEVEAGIADSDSRALPRSRQLSEVERSWLLQPRKQKRNKNFDLGCVVCSRRAVKWCSWIAAISLVLIVLPLVIVNVLPRHHSSPPPPDKYAVALKKSLLFFDAQMAGKLPHDHRVPWRGNSGMQAGLAVRKGLTGGFYDAGDIVKSTFPMAFSISMLSWSMIEYNHKYQSLGEYEHARSIIRWGTDYLLHTFDSSATSIQYIYSQVGVASEDRCWQRPEDVDFLLPILRTFSGPDLAGEMAAAFASASIVFRDDSSYSRRLVKAAGLLLDFTRKTAKSTPYSLLDQHLGQFYNSTGFYDECMWGTVWTYFATGNSSLLSSVTGEKMAKQVKAFSQTPPYRVLSWDNKFPAAQLLLTKMRMFLNPGYPSEEMLQTYHKNTDTTVCSYMEQYGIFNFSRGGLIQLSVGGSGNLQYVSNAAFLVAMYVDYMNAAGIPGLDCGPSYFPVDRLRHFATSQVDYILGANPRNMSYLVGYGEKFPRHVHHRGASIPHDGKKRSCVEGLQWRVTQNPNPNNVTGAMVAGPDKFDMFYDVRTMANYTEPTLVGNAGLVCALASLTSSGGLHINKNSIFSAVSLFPASPPPPAPWEPHI